jgi:ankyrin repeat protein
MDLSRQVYDLCRSESDKSEELTALLQDHPEVDVNLYRDTKGYTALHGAAYRGNVRCMQVLIGHGADVEARTLDGSTPIMIASEMGRLECLKVLIEARADVHAKNSFRRQAMYYASYKGRAECLKLLIHEGADVNAQDKYGYTPVIYACQQEGLTCLQLLLDAKADITVRAKMSERDALYWAIRTPPGAYAHRVPGMPFSVMSCATNASGVHIDRQVHQDVVDRFIAKYKAVHAFIDEHHNVLKHALSYDVQVDWRVGLGENGIYQEPLERVLQYMGLSMDIDQVVNRSIDGDTKRRALLPGNVLEANHWHEEYTRAASRAARATELAQKLAELTRELQETEEKEQLATEATRQARRAEGGY